MPPKKKSIETLRADQMAKDREADIVHLMHYVPPLIIGPFFWGLKCLITIFFGSLIMNVADTFCTAPLDTFMTLQLTSAYVFLFMWGWIIIGPVPCKKTKPIFILYGIYAFTQFVFGILGTIWYRMGRLECSESVPELTQLVLFEVIAFWLSYIFGGVYIGVWLFERHQKNKTAVSKSSSSGSNGKEDEFDDLDISNEDEEEVGIKKEETKHEQLSDDGDEEEDDDEDIF